MVVKIRKMPRRRCYRVYDGKKITAECTTREKAERQARLLRGVAHGFKPTGKRK